MTMISRIAALGLAGLVALAPVAALADTKLGVYQTTDRKMDYELRLCGSDGQHLCVRLLDARGSARTDKTAPFIGKDIVTGARPAGKNAWNGHMQVSGYGLDGDLKLTPGKKFVMSGCAYLVMCFDFTLVAAKG